MALSNFLNNKFFLILILISFIVEFLYFKLAGQLNILDHPNKRSSHQNSTIRGGGIVFPLAWLGYAFWNGFAFPYFTIGLILISAISLADDFQHVPKRWRLSSHLTAFTLCFQELHVFEIMPFWQWPLLYVVCIGVVNAFNFMDGINGITGFYTLSILIPLSLQSTNYWDSLHPNSPFPFLFAAIISFGFFNFRIKAWCFAGDIGSVSIGFLLVFFLLSWFLSLWHPYKPFPNSFNSNLRSDFYYFWPALLILVLYGIDTVLTIIYRIFRKDNIFTAHRLHLYQYLANEKRWPHLWVAGIYATIQLVINLGVVSGIFAFTWGAGIIILLGGIYFLVLRKRYLRS